MPITYFDNLNSVKSNNITTYLDYVSITLATVYLVIEQ